MASEASVFVHCEKIMDNGNRKASIARPGHPRVCLIPNEKLMEFHKYSTSIFFFNASFSPSLAFPMFNLDVTPSLEHIGK